MQKYSLCVQDSKIPIKFGDSIINLYNEIYKNIYVDCLNNNGLDTRSLLIEKMKKRIQEAFLLFEDAKELIKDTEKYNDWSKLTQKCPERNRQDVCEAQKELARKKQKERDMRQKKEQERTLKKSKLLQKSDPVSIMPTESVSEEDAEFELFLKSFQERLERYPAKRTQL
jgi:hypothetical protein